MHSLIKKMAKLFKTANYCLASAEVYLNEANRK